VARLIYAFLALSLGTLVAGFLIRDSSVPLFVSIGLSAVVLVLILVGTSRRLRRANDFEDEQTELADLEIVEIDDEAATTEAVTRKPRPSRRRGAAARGTVEPAAVDAGTVDEDTRSMETVEAILAADEAADDVADEPAETEVVVGRTRRAAGARPSRRRAVPEPSGSEAELEPMLAIEEAEAEPTDVVAPEPAAAAERGTIEMPPPRKPGRRRRVPPARDTTTMPTERRMPAAPAAPAGLSPPGLSPKVWVIPGRSRYHTQDCRFAKGDELREVTEATAQRRGYVACNVCKPGTDA
jgi:hypothetical protein